jgi:choice-of-anchor B domain-containing protein
MKKQIILSLLILLSNVGFGQTPCENGKAGEFPCRRVDLYAHLDNSLLSGRSGIEGNDIWGWTDPMSGKEYALMGQTNGTVFVDLSNPNEPQIIGRLPSHQNTASLWRDVKVYDNHAFIVADNNSGHGMQVFDLKRLRNVNTPPQIFTADARYTGVSSAHNIVINPEKGLAYIVGARGASNNCGAGGLHIVDISNPLNPTYAGCFDSDGYTHDAQVVTYHGPDIDYQGMQIAFNANENTITIANVENSSSGILISKQGYAASAYAHQGWLTEDHRYLISNDELDEIRGLVSNTRTLIWDVTDLNNPILMNEYSGNTPSIDHNLYTHQGIVYQSNYTKGLVLLDASEISNASFTEVGFFDTYPANNDASFNGTWSNYPYFKSGLIIVSDINRGLFVLKRSEGTNSVLSQQPIITYQANSATANIVPAEDIIIDSYEWEVRTENNEFSVLENNEIYSGVSTEKLEIDFSTMGNDEQRYRCRLITADGASTYSALSNPVKRSANITKVIKPIAAYAFTVYPNPATDKLYIENDGTKVFKSFTIYTADGKVKLEGNLHNNTIDISTINAGVYLLFLKDEKQQIYYKKIVK